MNIFSRNFLKLARGCLLAVGLTGSTLAYAAEDKTRYMLEGVATSDVFAALIKSPQDRGPNARGLMEKAGCELIDYYLGVHNYKSYIIIDCGPNADFAALQIVVFGGGGVASGSATEIMTTAELAERARAAGKLVGSYKVPE